VGVQDERAHSPSHRALLPQNENFGGVTSRAGADGTIERSLKYRACVRACEGGGSLWQKINQEGVINCFSICYSPMPEPRRQKAGRTRASEVWHSTSSTCTHPHKTAKRERAHVPYVSRVLTKSKPITAFFLLLIMCLISHQQHTQGFVCIEGPLTKH
jgi:hypothetical protein